MSFAWTTIVILILLLPGIAFFIGLATYERLSREIVRSSVISEVAAAVVVSLIVHTCAVALLSTAGFRLSQFVAHIGEADLHPAIVLERLAQSSLGIVIYILGTAAVAFGAGCLVAVGVVRGPLRKLAMHKWVYDIIDTDRRKGIITAYVMTNVVEDKKVLMYRGRLHEIFLGADGKIAYLILKNCARFFMLLSGEAPSTTKQLELFGARQSDRATWDYLQIEGDNIANVLFDPSPQAIKTTNEGQQALRAELERRRNEARPILPSRS